jgi:nicotinic acid mononucleotide adenylyltransferase
MIAAPGFTGGDELACFRDDQWAVYRVGQPDRPMPRAVYPGAFDPWHAGHRRIAELATARLGVIVEFEISLINVDKPPLSSREMERRISQFTPDSSIWLTQAPTFVEKSRLFPGTTFILGADTLLRVADTRYYNGEVAKMEAAIQEILARDCRFLVFGRQVGERFRTLANIDISDTLRQRCEEVPPGLFRMDISSTEIRRSESRR